MQATIELTEFQRNLALVLRAIPSRPIHPILTSVVLECDEKEQQIKLTAFDLSIAIETSFDAQVQESGKFAIPAKLLYDIVSRIGSGDVSLSWVDGAIEIKSEVGKYKIQATTAEEYPELPKVSSNIVHRILSATIIEGLKCTAFAASIDETKQVLTGIRFSVFKDKIKFAATDGHRLVEAIFHSEKEDDNDQFAITIPARVFTEIEKILVNQNELFLCFDDSQVVASAGRKRITARVLDGLYPNYESLFPKEFNGSIVVEKQILLAGLDRISVLASQKNNLAKCKIDESSQQVILLADCADVGSGSEALPAQISCKVNELAFNCKYIADGIKAIKSSEIEIKLVDEKKPITITPVGGAVAIRYLVMPVQLRD